MIPTMTEEMMDIFVIAHILKLPLLSTTTLVMVFVIAGETSQRRIANAM